MENNKVWIFDFQKMDFYRVEGNVKIYQEDDIASNIDTCYTTYLSPNNVEKRVEVISCIANPNEDTLGKSLDIINDHDVWFVTADNIKKVSPNSITLILRKFGFKKYEAIDRHGIKYFTPLSYEEWEDEIVPMFPTDVQRAILNNENLKMYLRGIVDVCRNNPIILNRDIFINYHYVSQNAKIK